jgi:hypothetical protein
MTVCPGSPPFAEFLQYDNKHENEPSVVRHYNQEITMQTLYEAAQTISQEIERTREHLAKLEQALQGLRPLIVVEDSVTHLPYDEAPQIETIEDIAVIIAPSTAAPASRAKGKRKAKKKTTARKLAIPKTGASLWTTCLGRRKLTLNDLTAAALHTLGLGDDAKAAIRNRAGAWLHAALAKNQVVATQNRAGLNVYQLVR